ncbi:MAG: translation initiation factor IF-2, partial [Spirochaetia bacterium]|nr:translation initiation factor IF-2 [Spirochaetia bacterium]
MMRIHDAAKLLKIASKDLISMLHAMGVEAKNHMAVIADEDYEKLRGKMFNKADLPPASSFVAPVKPVKKTAHHTNPEHKPGPEIKPESKAETKPQPKPVVKPEPKAEPKMEHHEPAKLHATPEPPGAENHVKHEIKKEEHKSAQAAPVVQKPQAAPAQHKPAEHNQKPAAPKPQPKPQPQPEPQPKPAEAVKPAEQPVEEPKEVLELGRSVTVQEMAQKLELKPAELVKKLFSLGMMATMNQTLTEDEIHLIAAEYNKEVKFKDVYGDDIFVEEPDDPKKMVPRGPIVTIMGHVDHGKTSLLDAIRETNVAAGEKGGITQKIGAYKVPTSHGNITFLDTPGHEAFTAMRARGAKSTDIVVLIVAADDGIMPQTVEAIDHARAAGVPIIVAINKIDKDGANPENIKQQLTKYNLVSEEWGGKTQIVPVSAKKKIGIADLLERIALEAEMLELKTNPDATAQGVIIEAKLDRGRGAVGTLLLQKGTIRVGDSFLTNFTYGKVRALFDDKGRRLKEAKSVMPVEILGFEEVPNAGDKLKVFPSEKEVKNISMRRAGEIRRFAEEKKKKKI